MGIFSIQIGFKALQLGEITSKQTMEKRLQGQKPWIPLTSETQREAEANGEDGENLSSQEEESQEKVMSVKPERIRFKNDLEESDGKQGVKNGFLDVICWKE